MLYHITSYRLQQLAPRHLRLQVHGRARGPSAGPFSCFMMLCLVFCVFLSGLFIMFPRLFIPSAGPLRGGGPRSRIRPGGFGRDGRRAGAKMAADVRAYRYS